MGRPDAGDCAGTIGDERTGDTGTIGDAGTRDADATGAGAMAGACDARRRPLSVRANMAYNTAGSLAYQLCLWLTTMAAVLLSDTYEGAGELAFAMSVGNMMSAIGTYDMRTYQVSDTTHAHTQREYVGFRIVTVAIGAALTTAYAALTSPDAQTLAATIAFIAFKADEAFDDVLYGVEQASGRMDYVGRSEALHGALSILAFASALCASGSMPVAIAAMLPASVAVTLAYDVRRAGLLAPIRPAIGRRAALSLLARCLPMVVGMLLVGMVASVPRQYYANAYGNDALGAYATVATPAVVVQATARYLYAPLLVGIAGMWNGGDGGRRVALRYVARVVGVMVAAMAVAVPVLSAAGAWFLVAVYGGRVSAYVCLLPGALVGTATTALLGFLSDVLIVGRDMRGVLLAAVMSLGVSVATMMSATKAMGLDGINVTVIAATGAGIVVSALAIAADARRSDSTTCGSATNP